MSDPAVQQQLLRTPLHAQHVASGARMTAFVGWEMPIQYTGIAEEHQAVRSRAGLFDVSHMGEIEVAGPGGLELVQQVTCNDAAKLEVGQAQVSALLTPAGTFIDDLLVYRLASSHFLLVVNAANRQRDVEWISAKANETPNAAVVDSSSRYAMLALQGPTAESVLQSLTAAELSQVPTAAFTHGEVAGARALIARTGYTGEDGFEVLVPPATAESVWLALLEAGRGTGVVPCGLGARDTLRLEAGMRLHGQDIDETTTPLEAGLSWMVGWEKDRFIGLDALRAQKDQGIARKLVGFKLQEAGIARSGCGVVHEGAVVGTVTSGTRTPTLACSIGLAYVPPSLAMPGQELLVEIRDRRVRAEVVRLPFYKRPL